MVILDAQNRITGEVLVIKPEDRAPEDWAAHLKDQQLWQEVSQKYATEKEAMQAYSDQKESLKNI